MRRDAERSLLLPTTLRSRGLPRDLVAPFAETSVASSGIRRTATTSLPPPWIRRVLCLVLSLACLQGGRVGAQFDDLSVLDPADFPFPGRVYLPSEPVRGLGGAVAAVGDLNRDRRVDIAIAADGAEGDDPGTVFVVLAPPPSGRRVDLVEPQDSLVRIRSGSATPDGFGAFVAPAGDVDGDGFDDLVIGTSQAHLGRPAGTVYLVFGGGGLTSLLDLSQEDSARSIALTLRDGGSEVVAQGVGDFNGDGIDDLALGAGRAGRGDAATGRLVILFGDPALRGGAPTRELGALTPPAGLILNGPAPGGRFGAALASLGDLDGDGLAEVAIGAPQEDAVYVLFGHDPEAGGVVDPAAPDGTALVVLGFAEGAAAGFGSALSGGRDATGDGVPDLLVGAPRAPRDGRAAGLALVVSGARIASGIPTLNSPGEGTPVFIGPRASLAGSSVALVPDLNDDGIAEILVGAPGQRAGSGAAYLVPGGGPGAQLALENEAVTFLGSQLGADLGAAVAGVPDRTGDGRGELLVGAPGQAAGERGGSGAAFELFLPPDSDAQGPRGLLARPVSGGRVLLTWAVSRDFRFVRVVRDDEPITGRLRGSILHFVDTDPGPGLHTYRVVAEDDPDQTSNPALVDLTPLPVRDLRCNQVPQTSRVRVRWAPGDFYTALRVFLDGQPASELLPGNATRFELDVPPGSHLIEVTDPVSDPEGLRASCRVNVVAPVLPAIEGFGCEVRPGRRVRLSWDPSPTYAVFIVLRHGVPIAQAEGGTAYVDVDPPDGVVPYSVLGLHRSLHRGPETSCEVQLPPRDGPLLSGRIVFADGRRSAVRRGVVRVFDSKGVEVARAQPGAEGDFAALAGGDGPHRVVYQVELPATELRGEPFEGALLSTVLEGVDAMAGPVLVRLPLPRLLVSTVRASDPEATSRDRWTPLRRAARTRVVEGEDLTDGTLIVPVTVPVGLAAGSLSLALQIEALGSYLEEELGATPRAVDLVAYGAAGLAARLFVASTPRPFVRRLVLLGTPNLGTARAEAESRAELVGRPLRLDAFDSNPVVGVDPISRTSFDGAFFAAAEQTSLFLEQFNRLLGTRGTEVHLVAGVAGRPSLDALLGCSEHDDRVCAASALGGVDGAEVHLVPERHESLGRGPATIPLLLELLAGPDGAPRDGLLGNVPLGDGPVAGAPGLEAPAEGGVAAEVGGGAGVEASTFPPTTFYSGVLEPGGVADLQLVSDTSDSIIVILNSDLPGGIEFHVEKPSGGLIDPPAAGALPDVDYFTYGDGEGHEIQAYEFRPSEVGGYVARLENPDENVAIAYTLEMYAQSDIRLEVDLVSEAVRVDEDALVVASLRLNEESIPGAAVEMTVWRPDGGIDLFQLLDDGAGSDAVAGDGLYTALLPTAGQPGVHSLSVLAASAADRVPPFRREAVAQLRVQSNEAFLLDGFSAGVLDEPAGGAFETLWIEGRVQINAPGMFLITATLEDMAGAEVATSGVLIPATEADEISYRLHFDGVDIHAAGREGPYVLSRLELYDGSVGLVLADTLLDAFTTDFFDWRQFGLGATSAFIRGDSNADGIFDISDAITILDHLFAVGDLIDCLDAGDANADGELGISDASFLLNYLFLGRTAPAAPFPVCGVAPGLGCEKFQPCN